MKLGYFSPQIIYDQKAPVGKFSYWIGIPRIQRKSGKAENEEKAAKLKMNRNRNSEGYKVKSAK